jgi:hypothetical protein
MRMKDSRPDKLLLCMSKEQIFYDPKIRMDTVQMAKMTGNFYGSKEDKKGLLRQRL